MGELEFSGVEKISGQDEPREPADGSPLGCDGGRCAVKRVTDHRVTQRGHVNANLVGAAGLDANRDQSEVAIRTVNAAQALPMRDCGAAPFATGGDGGSANRVTTDRRVDRAPFLG